MENSATKAANCESISEVMFDVTPDEIAELNDTDLRELVGRLCEAELTSRGLSSVAVTWGGNQTAPDGGLDVRVALTPGTFIEGFIPSSSTGFQVKTPDMARTAILTEMRPAGKIRPVLQELADNAGAYIIVSSHGSTADGALKNRRNALREALNGLANADQLYTDFYDRTRLATWVRLHPGLVTWVKEKIGRSFAGWRPYGPWSGPAEGVEAEYLLDDKLRLHLGKHRDTPAQSIVEAIDELRDELAQPRKIVRLVGLSGVGKTRLVQALFDARIGSRPLAPSLAVYTNLSDNPNPQPTGLASDLIANRARAILVVDNCPPDLHRRLSDLCAAADSLVSVLTIEYDVRDDQPEGTQVITLDTSSPELIAKLVARRYPHISEVDTRTIAEVAGGNARIAIAIAETVRRSETIAGLSDEELFQRLFRQRHNSDDALLIAAQVCSLVYSFEGEALAGDEAELPRLALLADQTPRELYRHVGELLRRDLVQSRSVWRAVLPHAIANRLASRALEDIPYNLIAEQFITNESERLARSFSRRLSYLHEHPRAISIAEQWLRPGGLLGNVIDLNELGQAMLENIAPVAPEATLSALERAGHINRESAIKVWYRHRELITSLAYDPILFERSVSLLVSVATEIFEDREAKGASDTFASLFKLYLSGTHATIEQRLDVIERLLRSSERKCYKLGLAALSELLEANYFASAHQFQFGARSRDHGYEPQTPKDIRHWYSSALALIERLAVVDGIAELELRELLGKKFRSLWTSGHISDELESLSLRFAGKGFWREGWLACRQVMYFDKNRLSTKSYSKISALELKLRPNNLKERIQAIVLGDRNAGLDLGDLEQGDDIASGHKRLERTARELGEMVANDKTTFTEIAPELLQRGNRLWAFGRGLAGASESRCATWMKLVECLGQVPPEQRNIGVLMGYLFELWEQDRILAQTLLDDALNQPFLIAFLPKLHSAVELDKRGVERMKQLLRSGQVPIWNYQNLAGGRTTDRLAGEDLRDLLLLIAEQPDGLNVALDILNMRLFSDRSDQREYEPELLEVGKTLLQHVNFKKTNNHEDYVLAEIVRICLRGTEAGTIAADLAEKLRQAVATHKTNAFEHNDVLKALLEAQPTAVLDTLLKKRGEDLKMGIDVFDHLETFGRNPADEISCQTIVDWCDRDRDARYPFAASIVTFVRRDSKSGPRIWSEHAKALLTNAPDAKSVLAVFVDRFWPTSWTGSRAALVEANAQLLDNLDQKIQSELGSFIVETKAALTQKIVAEKKLEAKRDKEIDERFE